MKLFNHTLISVSILSLAGVPALADHHKEGEMHQAVKGATISGILASETRAKDAGRDVYRHPAETLDFFGITPEMKVGEYSPGGGWYTRVLLPYLAETGTYAAINTDVDAYMAGASEERMTTAKSFPETFPLKAAEWTGIDASKIAAFEIDEAPDGEAGTYDSILVFRALHGLAGKELVDSMLADTYSLLKPGGTVGVVQHRAKEDAAHDYTQGGKGYLKQSEVIAMFESEGFDLVASSEVNANPDDTADYEAGVWTLPPVLALKDENAETYKAIGESDRMTLLFRKPAG